jgi:hypothetical protein
MQYHLPKQLIYQTVTWDNIKALHALSNHGTKNNLIQKFNHSTLHHAGQLPDEWFSELDIIRIELLIQYSHDISESDTFNHIIYNLKPKIYEINLAMIKREMNDPSFYAPNLNNLKRDIRQIYTNSKSTTVTTNKSGEMILAAIQTKGKPKFKREFKGECRICGDKGLKAADCWDNDKNKSKRPNNYKKKTPDNPSSHHPQKKKLKCDYCHKEGHTIEHCYRKKKEDRKENKDHHMVFIAIDGDNDFPLCNEMSLLHRSGKDNHDASLRKKYNMTRDTFVFDSGASSHMRFSKDDMVNLKPLKIAIKVGNAENIYSEAIGTFKDLVTQKDGSTFPITIGNVLYIPDLFVNLFSMTRVLRNKTVDFKREKGTIELVDDKDHKPLFDKIIEVGRDTLLGVDIVPHQENLHIHIRSYKELHEQLGHPNA